MLLHEAIEVVALIERERCGDGEYLLFSDLVPAQLARIQAVRESGETWQQVHDRLVVAIVEALGSSVIEVGGLVWRVGDDDASIVCHSIAEDYDLEV